jgi:hypothetical protein
VGGGGKGGAEQRKVADHIRQENTNCMVRKYTYGRMSESWTHLVEGSHGGGSGRNDVVYEEEESVLWSQADPFPDEEVELAHCQVYIEGTRR